MDAPSFSPNDNLADNYKQDIGRILKQKDKEINQKDEEIKKLKEF